ncbi:MAG: ABC transporter permease [Methylobacteriaceae bacterium]|nr:ABC transporter permease [Methylobacteriaceae bacterium]
MWMTIASASLGTALGIPIGVFLATTKKNELFACPWANVVVGFVANYFRAIPFIILAVAMMPFTRALVGSGISITAAIVVLAIAATPFIARLIETAIREVDQGLIEAARAYGASPLQIVFKVLIPEALPSIVLTITNATVALIGYTAMVGALGVGGLGQLAINHGYQQNKPILTWTIVNMIVVIVVIVQYLGERLARRVNKRVRT